MKFTTIDGVDVSVRVNNADEARHALKELRLARKQALHEKRGLTRGLKSAEAREDKAAKRPRRRPADGDGAATYVWKSLVAVARFAAGKEEAAPPSEPRGSMPKPASPATLERQIAAADALMHNIDACILQIEARLLKEKAAKR